MRVFELITALGKYPANADVTIYALSDLSGDESHEIRNVGCDTDSDDNEVTGVYLTS